LDITETHFADVTRTCSWHSFIRWRSLHWKIPWRPWRRIRRRRIFIWWYLHTNVDVIIFRDIGSSNNI
jgi:hypothetical protein